MKKIAVFILLIPFTLHALEVDEKLTVRILKISESKKTIMVNRGTEDGLVEGDHAKFVVTAGIVARAVSVRVSPTRSVWSVYRLVNADFIVADSVMTIKITPAVKITKDESQTLVKEDTPTAVKGDGATLGIPLADGAQDLGSLKDEKLAADDMKSVEDSEASASIVDKNMEAYGFVNISGLNSSNKTQAGGDSFSNSQSFYHIGLGGEWYARREREWYSRFSLIGQISLMRENSQAYNGVSVVNEITEFSVGTNWHPFKLPSMAGEFIPYIHGSLHFGSAKSSFTSGTNNLNEQGTSATAGTTGASLGFGYKFYIRRGFGARMLLDYYMRSEKYGEVNGFTHTKTVSGPRFMVGLSYRF